uniref:Venom protein n=1 Tax=Strongyloides stercoralis TaxID=6248 RepID=A0A0K0E5M4_STRER
MKYLFIVAVALALIAENGISAVSVSQSTSCDNSGCVVICKFEDSTPVSFYNIKECHKECTKNAKIGVCRTIFDAHSKKVVRDDCICE